MVGKLPFSAESIFQLAGMARNGRDGPLRGLSPMASWSGVFQESTGGLVCTRQTTQYHGAPSISQPPSLAPRSGQRRSSHAGWVPVLHFHAGGLEVKLRKEKKKTLKKGRLQASIGRIWVGGRFRSTAWELSLASCFSVLWCTRILDGCVHRGQAGGVWMVLFFFLFRLLVSRYITA